MAPRSNWKGYLKLSLVSCPVQLYPATSTKDRVSFHMLNRDTGNRLRRKMVDPETEEAVESGEQVRGFEIAKNEYMMIEDEEIDQVAIESSHTIDIEAFVPRTEIDETFIDSPYYLAPDGKMGEEAFAVIREAMREKNVVGLGRVVLFRRERPIMLEPRGKGLVATTLRYAYEVRDDADYFEDIKDVKLDAEMLDLATHIIGRKLTSFDPSKFEDRYQNALLELIAAKREHRPARVSDAAPKPGNVVSLMDALRRSIAGDQDNAKPAKASGRGKPAAKAVESAPAAKDVAPAAKAQAKPAAPRRKAASHSGAKSKRAA